jgi:hypothetical protein
MRARTCALALLLPISFAIGAAPVPPAAPAPATTAPPQDQQPRDHLQKPSEAPPSPAWPADTNAFDAYTHIFEELGKAGGMPDPKVTPWSWINLGPVVRANPGRFEHLLPTLIEATRLENYDSRVRKRPNSDLPNFSAHRALVSWLVEEAARCAAANNGAKADELLAAALRLSIHTSRGWTLIEKLAAHAMLGLCLHHVGALLADPAAQPAELPLTLAELKRLGGPDPLDYVSSFRVTKEVVGEALRRGYYEQEHMMRHLVPRRVRQEAAKELAPRYEAAMDRIIEAWTQDDGAEKLAEVYEKFSRERHDWVLFDVSSILPRYRKECIDRIASLCAQLEGTEAAQP